MDADKQPESGYFINRAFASSEKACFIAISSYKDFEDLRFEVYRNDELVANSKAVSDDSKVYMDAASYGAIPEGRGLKGKGEYVVITSMDGTEYGVSTSDMLTVKIYDNSDKLVYEETVSMDGEEAW